MPVTLSDVQREVERKFPGRDPVVIATALHAAAAELVRVTGIEARSSTGRNLASAGILSDILMGVCQYSNARGWNADRLADFGSRRMAR